MFLWSSDYLSRWRLRIMTTPSFPTIIIFLLSFENETDATVLPSHASAIPSSERSSYFAICMPGADDLRISTTHDGRCPQMPLILFTPYGIYPCSDNAIQVPSGLNVKKLFPLTLVKSDSFSTFPIYVFGVLVYNAYCPLAEKAAVHTARI